MLSLSRRTEGQGRSLRIRDLRAQVGSQSGPDTFDGLAFCPPLARAAVRALAGGRSRKASGLFLNVADGARPRVTSRTRDGVESGDASGRTCGALRAAVFTLRSRLANGTSVGCGPGVSAEVSEFATSINGTIVWARSRSRRGRPCSPGEGRMGDQRSPISVAGQSHVQPIPLEVPRPRGPGIPDAGDGVPRTGE